MTSVTIVITSYNCKDYIAKAIESCVQQTGQFEIQIIVVDDCSTDGTWELLKKLTNKVRFILMKTPENVGPAAARNLGIEQARGAYINFLDGDDYLLPRKISKQIKMLELDGSLPGVYCDSKIEKKDGITSIKLSEVSPVGADRPNFLTHLLKTNCIALHSVLLKTSIAKSIMFDESLRRAEDYDFWLRVVMNYGGLVYLNEPLVVYRKIYGGLSSNVIGTIDDNIKVLEKVDYAKLNVQQANNLRLQKDSLLSTAAHLRLVKFQPGGFGFIDRVADNKNLAKSQRIALRLSLVNRTLALIVYNILVLASRVREIPQKFNRESKIIREFNR